MRTRGFDGSSAVAEEAASAAAARRASSNCRFRERTDVEGVIRAGGGMPEEGVGEGGGLEVGFEGRLRFIVGAWRRERRVGGRWDAGLRERGLHGRKAGSVEEIM